MTRINGTNQVSVRETLKYASKRCRGVEKCQQMDSMGFDEDWSTCDKNPLGALHVSLQGT